ncbi:efflux RND transporter permease subunit [Blautia sp. HCP3S3_G3]|uniref:efflux RND transporter permease subunit n=1 Tax=Blautia sp. HCP3S3_G3 TaxID=3438913 RepID=UPI003F8CF044
MISRYSVKKPYTVVVAIVLVLILGAVSFTKMNTDLLPSMNLPYAIVMTTYPGASPETVETVVTRPIEQSMATVSDIENVSSQSRENVSLVILEFQGSTNMDSATIEIREKLDQISGYWEDSVSKPMIMKLNPDMMPIMVAAVEIDGLESTEVTDYVEKKIEAEMESVAGVASVSTTGNITESVDVLIREDKITSANQKVMKAIDQQFEEKEKELEDAQKELDEGLEKLQEGKDELEEGRTKLESGKDEMVQGIAQGTQQMMEAENQLAAGEAQIQEQEKLLEEKQAELDSARTQLADGRTQAEDALSQLGSAQTGIQTLQQAISRLEQQEAGLSQNLTAITEGINGIDQQLAALEMNPEALDYETMKASLQEQRASLEQNLSDVQNAQATLSAQKAALNDQLNQIASSVGKDSADEALAYITEQTTSLWNTLEDLSTKEQALAEGQAQLDSGKETLNAYKKQIASGKQQLSTGKIEMDTRKLLASIDMSVAESQLASGSTQIEENESKMEEAQAQLDSGKEQLKEAKKAAKDQTNLKNLITSDLVRGILAGENFSMPAGYIQEGNNEYLVRVGDKIEDIKNLEDLVLLDLGLDGLDPIRLKDIADITIWDDSDEVYARLNGNPGVMLTIEKQTGYSTGDVTDTILERIDEIEAENPDVHFSVLMDQGVYIDLVVDSVMKNMISGAILAVLILLLFLKDIRPTVVIAFSIPISVVASFVLMYFSGITLNVISLSGLALGIGMLVDNSIVVIENIQRMRQNGVPARKAAIEGAQQVAGAITASTLTTVCVFAPIVFTEGITRQLFVDMGLTIAYSLFASLVVALTLVPMMSSGLLKKAKPKKFRILDAIRNAYGKILGGALKVKFLVILLAIGLFAGSMTAALKAGTSFMPEMESTQATMTITTEKGTPFAETTACADEVIAKIEDIEDIESIGAMAGGGGVSSMMGGSSSDTNSVSVYLLLKEDKKLSGEELADEILKRTSDCPCEVSVSTQSMDMSSLGGSGIQVRIKGKELDELASIAKDIAAIVADTEGTQNVSDGQEDTDAEFRISVNKAKAMEYKLTVAQVYQEIQARIAEASSATTLSAADKDYSVYIRDEKDEKLTREDIQNLKIKVTGTDGEEEEIKISDIAEFTDATGPQTITRDAQSRYMTVSAEIANGYNIGLVSADVQKKLDDYEMPNGYTMEMKGEDETINDAMGQLMLMLVLALVFMYLIMVAQFQSLLSPFIIMFTIPLAFTGGFMGLLVTGMDVSVIAMIGFIMLSGIIVNNGIVLVDYTNQLRMDGMSKRDALIQAGKDRFRPIIMTALTTILGLSTMAAGMGMGGGMVQPMAIVTIGGLIYGTLLTLFVVPCIYDMLNRKEYKRDEIRLEDTDDGD